jgi:polyisoprenoid-binding protein YceI/rhodanese-related sulfurtransferase
MDTQFVERLSVQEVQAFLKEGRGVLIDTLPSEYYEARHIPGSANVCVYEVSFLESVGGIVPDKGTSVVCYGAGLKSFDCLVAAEKLAREGYTDVAVFHGGLDEWRGAGLDLEGAAPGVVELAHPILELKSEPYGLLPEESIINWTGRNSNGGHHGTLQLLGGELDVADKLAASFTIDMTSIRNINLEGDDLQPVLEAHLKSDDFFFSVMFPTAEFDTTQIKLVENGEATRPNAMIQGRLSLRGLTHEIAFLAHIRNVDEGKINILANLDFDRTQWGVIYGSSRFFQYLGYHQVFDFISIDFKLVLK